MYCNVLSTSYCWSSIWLRFYKEYELTFISSCYRRYAIESFGSQNHQSASFFVIDFVLRHHYFQWTLPGLPSTKLFAQHTPFVQSDLIWSLFALQSCSVGVQNCPANAKKKQPSICHNFLRCIQEKKTFPDIADTAIFGLVFCRRVSLMGMMEKLFTCQIKYVAYIRLWCGHQRQERP